MIKASVLMSIYNENENEIMEAVKSVLMQTFQDFEIIIVHDNPQSPDKKRIIESLKQMDKRITVIENANNMGLALSMNKAFKYATGNYIIRMDSDDISEPTRFQKEIDLLDTQKYDLVFTNYRCINENGLLLNGGRQTINFDIGGSQLLLQIVFGGIIHHPTVAMTREIFIKGGTYRNFPCSQDQDLWLRMIECGCRFAYLDEPLLCYRLRSNSITGNNHLKQYITITYIIELFIERLKNNGKDSFSNEAYQNYINQRISEKQKQSFERASLFLQKAKTDCNFAMKIVYRSGAFLISKAYRNLFVLKKRYKKLVLKIEGKNVYDYINHLAEYINKSDTGIISEKT